jgi:very-short-patch-repair endonuclease
MRRAGDRRDPPRAPAGSTFTWSELEECFLALVRRAHLPQPRVNEWIVLPDGEPAIRGDFVWRAQRLVVETDGVRTHRTRRAFELNRRNDQRLTLFGWRPLRLTQRQLTTEPRRVEQMLTSLVLPDAAT